jgi:endonuclease-3
MGGRSRHSTTPHPRGGAKRITPEHAARLAELLAEKWPDAQVELDHQNAYQLLVATILAAQSTDKLINTVTPALFARYPDATALAQAEQPALEQMVKKTGFYRMKAKHLIGMAQAVVQRHGGEIPNTMEALCALPGVARKTANVVLGSALDVHTGIVVDTHVTRLAARLHLSAHTDPVKIEQDLMDILPKEQWTPFAHRLIWHGRYICTAKAPDCDHCLLAPLCPSAFAPPTPAKPSARAKWNKANRKKPKQRARA